MRGGGDCEDLAIAAFFTLLDCGVAEAGLMLVWGALTDKTEHVLLAHTLPGETLFATILIDNLREDNRPTEERPDFTPWIGFNTLGKVIYWGEGKTWDSRPAQFDLPKWDRIASSR